MLLEPKRQILVFWVFLLLKIYDLVYLTVKLILIRSAIFLNYKNRFFLVIFPC